MTETERDTYDPFSRGRFPVGVATVQTPDTARGRVLPCEIWYPAAAHHAGEDVAAGTRDRFTVPGGDAPRVQTAVRNAAAQPGTYPLVVFSHHGGGHRRSATFLCTHLSSHGYVVAALDHWAVVALAPGGSSQPRPGIIPAKLAFRWDRDVPTLYLVAERDTATPLDGMYELFDRTPAARPLVVLRRADHLHFIDNVENEHEAMRAMSFPGEAAWIPKAMLPIGELCSGEQAHLFVRGMTLCHLDVTLRQQPQARRPLAGDIQAQLAARGVEVILHRPC